MNGIVMAACPCSVNGCGRGAHRRGLCNTHYCRWRTTGSVQADTPILTSGERARQRNVAAAMPTGSTSYTPDGYLLEKLSPDDPMFVMANQHSGKDWVLQHRLVVARSIGRPLAAKETVHHMNGLRDDNRLVNLELWEGRHGRGVRSKDPHCPTCKCGAP